MGAHLWGNRWAQNLSTQDRPYDFVLLRYGCWGLRTWLYPWDFFRLCRVCVGQFWHLGTFWSDQNQQYKHNAISCHDQLESCLALYLYANTIWNGYIQPVKSFDRRALILFSKKISGHTFGKAPPSLHQDGPLPSSFVLCVAQTNEF